MVYGLWTEDDSGLPTGPLTITKTLIKHFFDSLDSWTLGLIHVISLATQTLKTFFVNVLLEPYPTPRWNVTPFLLTSAASMIVTSSV